MPELQGRLQKAVGDRYRIERELGRGGMATVFLAYDPRHHRRVAIKAVDPEVGSAVGAERFTREIEAAAALTHPNVLPVFDSGAHDGLLWYAMPFVEGESLAAWLERDGPLPVSEALRLACEVGEALTCAHRAGLVHRDIKPGNVLLESGHAVVADFGLARPTDAEARARLTIAGVAVGTPAYMSPEQAAGGAVDARSDQYALACTLYEMLAGQPPFTGPSAVSVLHQHRHAAPRPVTDLRPAVPAAVARALGRALAKAPEDRFASVSAFTAALAAARAASEAERLRLDAAATAELPAAPRPRRAGLLLRPLSPAALAVVVAVIGVLAADLWFSRPPVVAGPRAWMLVSEFASAPRDSDVANATRDLVVAALEQSRIVTVVPPDVVRRALVAAGKPARERLDPALAREIAMRSSVRTVLEGNVGRLGPGYSIVLRVVDVDSARVPLTTSVVAKDAGQLVRVVGEAAKRLRKGLGESRASLAATRELSVVATPSFEAFEYFARARRAWGSASDGGNALRYCRAALALDPDFASAWQYMATTYYNIGETDSARACFPQVRRCLGRLSPQQRERFEILVAMNDNDVARVRAAIDRWLADDPSNLGALQLDAGWLYGAGRFRESLERFRQVARLSPFKPHESIWGYMALDLQFLGRFDEARAAIGNMSGAWAALQAGLLESRRTRWSAAESTLAGLVDDPVLEGVSPGMVRGMLAEVRFGRGALRAAHETMARARERARAAASLTMQQVVTRYEIEWADASSGAYPPPAPPDARDTTANGILNRGLFATVAGDLPLARRCAANVRARPAGTLGDKGAKPALLAARVATLAGRPQEAVELLRAPALRPLEYGDPNDGLHGLSWVRASLADAFEQLGRPDSAAFYLEQDFTTPLQTSEWGFVHCRLAGLDARLGRPADAARHLAEAERLWDQPDPPVRRLLDSLRVLVRAPTPAPLATAAPHR